jgi:thymidylate synthase
MKQYVDLLKEVLTSGEVREDRTGVGTKSVFGGQLTFDLRERFPLVTIKKTLWKSAFIEMLWFLRGEPNTAFLKQHNVPIWDDWADEQGNLGPVYGVQWRSWKHHEVVSSKGEIVQHLDGSITYLNAKVSETKIDQIKELIDKLKNKPKDRRLIVSAWNVGDVPIMGLPPCHRDFQCYVSNDGYLDLMWAQRSWDLGLGAPFNIAQYALLTHLLAQCAGLKPRYLKVNYGDAHVYLNHVDELTKVIANNKIIDCKTELVIKNDTTDIDSFKIEDFDVIGYESNPFVKLPIAV